MNSTQSVTQSDAPIGLFERKNFAKSLVLSGVDVDLVSRMNDQKSR